jgi:hypothetical protein
MKWYYYLHTNGDLIGKNPAYTSEADFTESDFVKTFWLIETDDRADAWRVVLEALARGARVDRVRELAEKWGLSKTDAFEMMVRNGKPPDLLREGLERFINDILRMTDEAFYKDFTAWGEKQNAEKKEPRP